jgi:hypothetical protein
VTRTFEEGTSGSSISVHCYTLLCKQIGYNPVHYTSSLVMEAENGHEMSNNTKNIVCIYLIIHPVNKHNNMSNRSDM